VCAWRTIEALCNDDATMLNRWECNAMKASMMLYPVDTIDAALPLFVDGLGLAVKFRDGERYCALDGGALTVALVAGEERIVERAALVFRVDENDDLYAAMARVVAAGASVRVPVQQGPHEWHAVLEDKHGALLVLSQKRVG
jgi:predicted enzyme related to lactoylglutathione lyase